MAVKWTRLTVGILTFLFIPFWNFYIFPVLSQTPTDFKVSYDLNHSENNRFDIGGKWSGKSVTLGDAEIRVTKTEDRVSQISSVFTVTTLTGETVFDLKQNFFVDRRTLINRPGGSDRQGGSYFLFPKFSNKNAISWRSIFFGESFPLQYIDTTTIQGQKVFHFRGQRQDINDTEGYSFLPLVPEKYGVFSRATVDVYVEPITGTLIDYQDSGVSYYITTDKQSVADIAEWGNKFSQETITRNIEFAQENISYFYNLGIIIPVIVFGLALLITRSAFSGHTVPNKKK